ncbi:MAG: MobC family plasmid mobilization relaxosome protein [Clostridia bacterium]
MRKDAQICLRLTKLQKEKILAKASQVNMNITDYMVNAGIKRKITITNIPDLYDVKIELKRIGNNLNQLTRLCNEGKINVIGLEDLKSEVSKIWQLLNLLTQKLH